MIKFLLAFMILSHSFAETMVNKKNKPLTHEEKALVEQGEMSTSRYVIGGILGVYPGFGIGHAVQERWSEKGWIFTAGELGSLAIVVMGAASCLGEALEDASKDKKGDCTNAAITIGMIGFLGFKIWEVVDIWATPPAQNKKIRSLKERQQTEKQALYLSPLFYKDFGGGLGLTFTF
jgi:hypothetical protein